MPVVRVHDVRRLIGERGRDRTAEERVPLRVVGRAVDRVATDALAVDEDDAHAVALDRWIRDPRVRRAVCDRAQGAVARDAPLRAVDGAVQRHVERDLGTELGEGLRKRAGDVGEPAHLGERRCLGGGEGDPEPHPTIVKSS